MAELVNKAGTRVSVSDELAEVLVRHGWKRPEEPARRKPGRPKKSE